MSKPEVTTSTFADQAARAVLLVKQASALLALSPRRLTSRQRRHGLKFRKGAEPSIRIVANLSLTHEVSVPGAPTSGMLGSLDRAAALRTVKHALVGALAEVDDAIYSEEGGAYGTALTLYGMLKKIGHRHAEIRTILEPVADFFAFRAPTEEQRAKRRAAAAGAAETGAKENDGERS